MKLQLIVMAAIISAQSTVFAAQFNCAAKCDASAYGVRKGWLADANGQRTYADGFTKRVYANAETLGDASDALEAKCARLTEAFAAKHKGEVLKYNESTTQEWAVTFNGESAYRLKDAGDGTREYNPTLDCIR